ncbi:hypothetical protein KM043_011780 [Ampulex compressa]|nr:hypothetical protein KM043_011780 [Ampulex compressa]
MNSEDFETTDYKVTSLMSKHIIADLAALSTICGLIFLFAIVSAKCDKDEEQSCVAITVETDSSEPEGYDLENPSRSARSKVGDHIHACGDSIHVQDRIPRSYPFVSSRATMQISRDVNFIEKPIVGIPESRERHCQGTQTKERAFEKTGFDRGWLVRRTRSGHVYGKYPM